MSVLAPHQLRALESAHQVIFNPAIAALMQQLGTRSDIDHKSDEAPEVIVAPPLLPRPLINPTRKERSHKGYIRNLEHYTDLIFNLRKSTKTELKERWEAQKIALSEDDIRAIHAASVSCRMAGQDTPVVGKHDLALLLGGTGLPVGLRLQHLGRRLGIRPSQPGQLSVDKIVLMGSQRPIADNRNERGLAFRFLSRLPFVDTQGLREDLDNAETEFDIMSIMVARMYNVKQSQPDVTGQDGNGSIHQRWIIRHLSSDNPKIPPIILVSAPSSDPSRRANTPDTYAFLRRLAELGLNQNSSVVIFNTKIYRFQELAAHNMLGIPIGCEFEMDGYPYLPPYVDENSPRALWNKGIDVFLQRMTTASTELKEQFYDAAREMLQEMKAAIDAAISIDRTLELEYSREAGI